ncbi:hypothetical protein GWK47_048331 [Chionoecetes opilio]|uniref:Uncharacterized protein n=1 Tax=Chionoecetes opilio TaxID=41210 RepID=A0A8J5CSB5_CHIOP|nr:hypothetical protein GWK47_048331 [Chionoecetes opilio]
MGGLECLRGGDGGLQHFMNHPYMTVARELQANFPLLERFTVIIYNKTSNLDSVNEARRELFSRRTGQWKRFPKSKKPFCSTHCAQSKPSWNFGQTRDQCEQKPPTPEGLDGTLESATKTWRPVWSNLPVDLRPARKWSSVAAKAPRAEDDAHARRRSGSAPNYAAANVNSLAEK